MLSSPRRAAPRRPRLDGVSILAVVPLVPAPVLADGLDAVCDAVEKVEKVEGSEEKIAELVQDYDLSSVAVVDEQGRLAGRIKPKHQIRHGFVIMVAVSIVNVVLNLLFVPEVWWAMLPIAIYSFGWALMVPVVTLPLGGILLKFHWAIVMAGATTVSVATALVTEPATLVTTTV